MNPDDLRAATLRHLAGLQSVTPGAGLSRNDGAAMERACWTCGASLEGRQRNAVTCSARCRQRRRRGQRDSRSERIARRWGLRPTDLWRTPPWLVAWLTLRFPLSADLSATAADAVCPRHLSPLEDGRTTAWGPLVGEGVGFWNPPYGGGLLAWVEKAAAEAKRGVQSVGLHPPSTGARYMELAAHEAEEILLIRGRVNFLHPDTGKPGAGARGDSCFTVWGGRGGPARWRYVDLEKVERNGGSLLQATCRQSIGPHCVVTPM